MPTAETHPISSLPAAPTEAPTLRLRLQRRGGAAETFVFHQAEVRIGRRPRGEARAIADLELPHRDVSRRQCRIFLQGARVFLEDLGSRGGTFLGGRPLRGAEPLAAGDTFSFGDYTASAEVLALGSRGRAGTGAGAAEGAGEADAPARPRRPYVVVRPGSDDSRDEGLAGALRRALGARGEDARAAARPGDDPGAPDPAQAETWWRLGEPAELLLRGRALRRASRWLAAHAEVHPDDRRRQWVLASQREGSRRRWLRAGAFGASLATILTAALLGDGEAPPELAAHARPASACTRARVDAARSLLEGERGDPGDAGVLRAAAALRWLAAGGCPAPAAELALDRALLGRSDALEATLPGAIAGITPIVGDHGRAIVHAADGSLHVREPAVHGLVAAMEADDAAGPWVWSADGAWWARVDGRGRVDVWTALREPARVASLAAQGPVTGLALDRGGRRLVIADADGLSLWERDGPRWEATARRPRAPSIPADAAVALAGDGVVFRSGARLWWHPLAGGPAAQEIAGDAAALVADGDEAWFVGDAGGELRRLRVRGRRVRAEVIARVGAPIAGLHRLAGGADLLVVADDALTVVRPEQRWRAGEALSHRLEGLGERPLAIASDDRWLVAAAPGRLVVWDRGRLAQDRRPTAEFPAELADGASLAVIDDVIVGGDGRGGLRRWPIAAAPGGLAGDPVNVGVRVDAAAIGGGGLWLAASGEDRRTRVWRRELAAPPVEVGALVHGHDVAGLAIDPRGRWLAVAHDRVLEIWSLGDRLAEEPRSRVALGAAITRLTLAGDGRWLVAGDARGGVSAWALGDEGIVGAPALSFSHDDAITALVAVPGAPAVVSGDRRGALVHARLDGGARRRLGGHARAVVAAAIDEAGAWLATSGEDGQIRLARLGAGDEARTIAHPGARALAFAPGGGGLVSGDDRGELWLHALAGDGRRRLGSHGPRARVRALAFDGPERLVSAGTDGALRIWELRRGVRAGVLEARALPGHAAAVRALAHDEAGRVVVTGGEDGVLRVWPLGAEERVLRACAIVGHGPDPAVLGGALPADFVRGVCR